MASIRWLQDAVCVPTFLDGSVGLCNQFNRKRLLMQFGRFADFRCTCSATPTLKNVRVHVFWRRVSHPGFALNEVPSRKAWYEVDRAGLPNPYIYVRGTLNPKH